MPENQYILQQASLQIDSIVTNTDSKDLPGSVKKQI